MPSGFDASRYPARGSPLELVAARYSSDAEVYEKTWAPVLRPHGQRLLERLPLALARRVLDAGAGVGGLLTDIRDAAPAAAVIALDCSLGMILRAPGAFPRVVMDVERLGITPAAFDVVVMAFMLFHVQDPLQALREARRVLRPGGTVGTITWDGEPKFPAQRVFIEELDAHAAAPADPSFVNHAPVSSPARIRSLLESAGFDGIHTWTAPFDHQYGLEEFVALRTTRGSTRRRFESLDLDRRAAFLQRVCERLAIMGSPEFVDSSEMIYATGACR